MAQLLPINSVTGNGASTSSGSLTLPATPTNGSSLYVAFRTDAGTTNHVATVSLTGATYAQIANTAVADGCNIEVWEAIGVSGANTALSFTFGTSQSYQAIAWELPGVLTIANIDGATTNHATGASSPQTAAMTTSTLVQQVEALFFVTGGTASVSGATAATPSGYTRLTSIGGGGTSTLAVDYKIFADTVQTQSATASLNGGSTLHVVATLFGVRALVNQLAERNSNSISGTSSTGSTVITLPKTPITGNTVFVTTESATALGGATTVSATNISFTKDVNETSGSPGGTIWRGLVGSSPGAAITVTSSVLETVAAADEFFGVLNAVPDKSTSNNGTGTTISTGTTGATTAADEVVIAYLANSTHQIPSSVTAGYTAIANVNPGAATALIMAYKIVAATGTQACSATTVGPGTWSGGIAAYKQGLSAAQMESDHLMMVGIGS